MRITVIPEQLRQVAQAFREAQSGWEAIGHRLRARQSALDWEVRRQQAIEEQIGQAIRLAQALAEGAGERASWLEAAAARFEAADREAYPSPAVSFRRASSPPIPRILGIWTTGPAPRNVSTRLIGGIVPSLGGVGAFALSGTLLQPLGDLAERVWNWVHGYGWRTNAELVASSTPSLPKGELARVIRESMDRQARKGKQAEAIRQGMEQQGSAPEQHQEGRLPVTAQISSPESSFGHDVPLLSQQGLQYRGGNTAYGCTPTAVSMVLEYWHRQDENLGTLSAQEILDRNIAQGRFNAGMSVTETHDEIQALGYRTVEDHINADFESLRRDVEKGPVVAVVKLGMRQTGTNHAVVVSGISEDGKWVKVNDPWDGRIHLYTREEFEASWGADFGDVKNSYMVIRP